MHYKPIKYYIISLINHAVTPTLILNKFDSTRSNSFKLEIQGSKHDFCKNSFCVRVPHIWNNFPNYVVNSRDPGDPGSLLNSKDVHQFKINMDNYWSKYDI